MNAGSILRHELAEVCDLTAHLQDIVADAAPLGPGAYAGAISTFQLGDLTIQVVRSAPLLVLGTCSNGGIGLLHVFEGAARARLNGRPVKLHELALCGNHQRHEAIYPDSFACVYLSCEGATAGLPLALQGDTVPSCINTDPRASATLVTAALAVEQAALAPDSILHGDEAQLALRASVTEAMRGLLLLADADRARARDSCSRQRIVHEVDEYLRAHAARPVYTTELCGALHISATRLHHAFSATFGISPHRYLKLRRMSMVRAALLSRNGPWRSVKAVALSHGFWHLGQFAHDYRALCGECPSETLARARPLCNAATPSAEF